VWLFVSFVSVWLCDGGGPVQGVPRLSPNDRWDRLQPPRNPTDGLSGYRKWMDGNSEDCAENMVQTFSVVAVPLCTSQQETPTAVNTLVKAATFTPHMHAQSSL